MTSAVAPPEPAATAGALDRLAGWLREAARPLLVAHVAPDADALGSALGVALALRQLGGRPRVSVGEEPFVVPRSLAFLPGQDLLVPPSRVEPEPDLVVAFDTSSEQRLGLLGEVTRRARRSAAVDHHASYTGFADLAVLDVGGPATALLALAVVDRLGAPLTVEVATCLYAGLTSDTGSFRHAGTTPEAHRAAARLLATGVRPDLVARRLFDDLPHAAVRLYGRAAARAELDPAAAGGLGLVWAAVPAAERRRTGVPFDALGGLVDLVRRCEQADVACVLLEDDAGAWQVSLRSKGGVDVAAVAVVLGGGGHHRAAGFTSLAGPAETVDRVRRRLVPSR